MANKILLGHWGVEEGLVLFVLSCFPTQLVGAESSVSLGREHWPSQNHILMFRVQQCVGVHCVGVLLLCSELSRCTVHHP